MRLSRLLLLSAAISCAALVADPGAPLRRSTHGRFGGAGPYPSDWWGMQRAYPAAAVNQQAYAAALDQARFERAQAALSTSSSALTWVQAGPYNIGGRVTALAVAPGGTTVFLGAANGGVFKSVNGGVNWTPIFDNTGMEVFSIGALALEPGNPNVLYVGTGEANASVDSYDGQGLFRSTDGGQTWASRGLVETARIARVAVDPSNTSRILVAAMGRQFSTGPDRGLYRSEDGGATWTKSLFVSDSTGACDVVFNPAHPETVFCATWERVRHYTYRRAYGPECGIWRSTDHGVTWTRLSTGLPAPSDNVGRIALAIAASQPSTIYAQIITGASGGYIGLGLYRSTDGGQTWNRRDTSGYTGAFGGFGWYFGDLAVDPTNPGKVYIQGQVVKRSTDGGVIFTDITGTSHVDFHGMWIDPSNPLRIYQGNDGGFYSSTNGGTSWSKSLDLPISQFYAGCVDPSNGNRLGGGTQDNGCMLTAGSPTAWYDIQVFGADGFYVLIDPTNPNITFSEYQFGSGGRGPYRSTNGGSSGGYGAGISLSDRFNWNAPFVMDPSNHNVLLFGSNRVWQSTDNGLNWVDVSPDLTLNTPSNLVFHTITTLEISPASPRIYYAGTDDGLVWRSLDGGGSWADISAGLPVRSVTRVSADPADSQMVYVTLSGFGQDEHLAHVYRSTDNGSTWTSIAGNLPDVPANDLIVDPNDRVTLYLATDVGVYITRNTGGTWYPFGQGMPLQAVFDLTLHQGSRTLVAATHGRSQWKVDLNELPVAVGPPAPATRLALSAPTPNPARGACRLELILPAAGLAEAAIFDASGRRVRRLLAGRAEAGRHALGWDGLDERGRRAPAGVYFVRASAAGVTATRRLVRLE